GGKKGAVLDGGTAIHENCVMAWGLFLQMDGTLDPMDTGNTTEKVGFCFPHDFYHFNTDAGGTNQAAYPNFATLPLPAGHPGTFAGFNPDDACDFLASGF